MKFRDWLEKRMLQEVGTGTNAIAVFTRPIFGEPFRRANLPFWGEQDPFFNRKQKEKKHRFRD